MKLLGLILLCCCFGCGGKEATPLPVVPVAGGIGLEELVRKIRDGKFEQAECRTMELTVCGETSETSVQYVQLDDDASWEAVITVSDSLGMSKHALVLDHGPVGWNMVGSFACIRHCGLEEMARVQRLTPKSPKFFLFHRDLGGSGSTFWTLSVFHLRQGRLWPVFEIMTLDDHWNDGRDTTRRQLNYAGDRYLVLHAHREVEHDKSSTDTCQVQEWDSRSFRFVEVARATAAASCDAAKGLPVPDQSFPVTLLR